MNVRLWFVRETEKARQYSKIPLDRNPEASDLVWVPRSLAEHTSKRGVEHTVTLPDWFVAKENL